MPLDHYISQVHLKNFYSPILGNSLYAVRKTDLQAFTTKSESVCRIMDGSANAYLLKDRAIEDFLKTIEPYYNSALNKLITKNIDVECIYTIAGFVAYVISCSPAAMRIHSRPLKSIVETTAAMIEAQGLLPPPPSELSGANLTELLHSGSVKVTVDPKYPQAIGISAIRKNTATFGNFKWEILYNNFEDSPFFTSDFPVAIEKTSDPRILNRVVPLSPNIAVRIIPDIMLDREKSDFTFKNFGFSIRKVSRQEVAWVNCLIVRCAEDTVFYRDEHPWVKPFIIKNRNFYIEPRTEVLNTPTGTIMISTQRIANRQA